MKGLVIPIFSFVLTITVLGNAFSMKKQYYPTMIYIINSNPSMVVIYLQSFFVFAGITKYVVRLFFGQLRTVEIEHTTERLWYAMAETCLAFAVFKSDFTPKFVGLFALLFFLKIFHWLCEERVDFMERSPIISFKFHVRILLLFFLLGAFDAMFIDFAYQSTLTKGVSTQIVFGFEYAILLATVFNLIVKYVLHSADIYRQTPWEYKIVFLLYTHLITATFKVLLYGLFVILMIELFTAPIFAIRPMFYAVKDLNKTLDDIVKCRRAIRNMNALYPDATPEDLSTFDNVCIICREEMNMESPSKKLPCNHIFHRACLRSWFQRQQTCPTCRLNILQNTTSNVQHQGRGAELPRNEQAQVRSPQQPQSPNNDSQSPGHQGNSNNQSPHMGTGPNNQANSRPPYCEGHTQDDLRRLERMMADGVLDKIKYLQSAQAFVEAAQSMLQQYQSLNAINQETQTFHEYSTTNIIHQTPPTTSDASALLPNIPGPSNYILNNEAPHLSENNRNEKKDFSELVRKCRLDKLNKKINKTEDTPQRMNKTSAKMDNETI